VKPSDLMNLLPFHALPSWLSLDVFDKTNNLVVVPLLADSPGLFGSVTLPVILIYSLIIICAALIGGWIPTVFQLTHNWMQILISLVGGLILGISIFHMLPHALAQVGPDGSDQVAMWMMAGLMVMFLLLRTFHFHQHEPPELIRGSDHHLGESHSHHHHEHHHHNHSHHEHQHNDGSNQPSSTSIDSTSANDQPSSLKTISSSSSPHQHSHSPESNTGHHHHHHHHHHSSSRSISWLGVMFGLSLHALLDGLAVAASVEADAHHSGDHATGLLGLGTFLAVALHTPLDAISITLLMGSSKSWTPRKRFLMVSLFSLMCPLGALIFWLGYRLTGGDASWLVGSCLAFSSGLFLCIALSDLLPEMEFHSHNRLQLSGALFAGILIAYMIGIVEPDHAHHHSGTKDRSSESQDETHDHNHADHNHADHDHADPSKPTSGSATR